MFHVPHIDPEEPDPEIRRQQKYLDQASFLPLYPYSSATEPGGLKHAGFEDGVQGVSGLIALGDAWGSPDVFHTMFRLLETDGQNSVAHLARLRSNELLKAGAKSFSPDQVATDKVTSQIVQETGGLEQWFQEARAKADSNHQAREAFMIERLGSGMHPDTDSDFWDGYTKVAAITDTVALPPLGIRPSHRNTRFLVAVGLPVLGMVVVGAIAVALFVGVRRSYARKE